MAGFVPISATGLESWMGGVLGRESWVSRKARWVERRFEGRFGLWVKSAEGSESGARSEPRTAVCSQLPF